MNTRIRATIRLVSLAVVLALVLLATGCALPGTPEATIREFFSGLNAENIDRILDTIAPSSSFANATLDNIQGSTFPDTNYTVVSVTMSGTQATVIANSTSHPTGRTYTFTMQEEPGLLGSTYKIVSWST